MRLRSVMSTITPRWRTAQPRGVALDPAAGLHPADRAVGLDQPVLLVEIAGGLQVGAAGLDQAREVVGVQGLVVLRQRAPAAARSGSTLWNTA
jgi:hypothetical protein